MNFTRPRRKFEYFENNILTPDTKIYPHDFNYIRVTGW